VLPPYNWQNSDLGSIVQKAWDTVIVGAGPAGASCAVWLRHLGHEPLLLESSDRLGGLAARNPFPDIWTLTSPGQTGVEVAQQMAKQVQAAAVTVWLQSPVIDMLALPQGFELSVARPDGTVTTVQAKTVVIASGVRAKGLGPGKVQTSPAVLVGPGEHMLTDSFKGLKVAILGGGDNAFENYELVKSRGAAKVTIFARSLRAQAQFVNRADPDDLQLGPYEVDATAATVNGQAFDRVLVFYGWEPCVDFLKSLELQRDSRNFVETDVDTAQTSMPGVYAIGEVAQRMHPCVPTAMADGVVAAKAIERHFKAIARQA
jgi:thioredoxin reductase (NADPH)